MLFNIEQKPKLIDWRGWARLNVMERGANKRMWLDEEKVFLMNLQWRQMAMWKGNWRWKDLNFIPGLTFQFIIKFPLVLLRKALSEREWNALPLKNTEFEVTFSHWTKKSLHKCRNHFIQTRQIQSIQAYFDATTDNVVSSALPESFSTPYAKRRIHMQWNVDFCQRDKNHWERIFFIKTLFSAFVCCDIFIPDFQRQLNTQWWVCEASKSTILSSMRREMSCATQKIYYNLSILCILYLSG